jgi:hypothetical protein
MKSTGMERGDVEVSLVRMKTTNNMDVGCDSIRCLVSMSPGGWRSNLNSGIEERSSAMKMKYYMCDGLELD